MSSGTMNGYHIVQKTGGWYVTGDGYIRSVATHEEAVAMVKNLDGNSREKPKLTEQVREAIDAGFNSEEGAEYTKIYRKGYSAIAHLIRMQRHHPEEQVRATAASYLTRIDNKGEIGNLFSDIDKLIADHPTKVKFKRHASELGQRRIRSHELARLNAVAVKESAPEEDRSKAKALLGAIVNGKLMISDYKRMQDLNYKHFPHRKRIKSKDGWRSIQHTDRPNLANQLKDLAVRDDVDELVKKKAKELIASIDNNSISSSNFHEARRLLVQNRASKKERQRRKTISSTFEDAVFMAHQACTNLNDMGTPVLSEQSRRRLIDQLNVAAISLLQIQQHIMEENDES